MEHGPARVAEAGTAACAASLLCSGELEHLGREVLSHGSREPPRVGDARRLLRPTFRLLEEHSVADELVLLLVRPPSPCDNVWRYPAGASVAGVAAVYGASSTTTPTSCRLFIFSLSAHNGCAWAVPVSQPAGVDVNPVSEKPSPESSTARAGWDSARPDRTSRSSCHAPRPCSGQRSPARLATRAWPSNGSDRRVGRSRSTPRWDACCRRARLR